MSIAHFIRYLDCEKNYSPYTITAYKNDITSFLNFCKREFEIEKVGEISYSIIRSWIVELVEDGISNRSVNRKISSLKTYFNFLMKVKEIDADPLKKHRALKVEKKVTIPFSKDEMDAVMNLDPDEEDFESIRDRLLLEMLYSTGMRRSELIHLKDASVDISKGIVKVVGKRNKERHIPLLNSIRDGIGKYREVRKEIGPEDDTFFVTSRGKKMYPNLVYRIVKNYFGQVSVKMKKSPHMVRHSFATHLLNEGADLNAVKELLGHASLASTQLYTHSSLNELKLMYNSTHPRSTKKE